MRRTMWNVWLPTVIGIVVLSFTVATILSQVRLMAIDRNATQIADDAIPSIEELTAARREIRQLQLVAREQLEHAVAHEPVSFEAFAQRRRALDDHISRYLVIPTFLEEQKLWSDILQAQGNVDDAVVRLVAELTRGDHDAARKTVSHNLTDASHELNVAIGRTIDFNATHTHDLAEQIRSLRGASMFLAIALDGICIALAMGAVVILGRALRRHSELAEQHRQLLEERASELEEFAGRVAHDIRSPIGTVSLALSLAERAKDDAQREMALARGKRAVQRVTRLVDALLTFAKAAAKPDPSARANVVEVLDDVVADLGSVARGARVTLTIDAKSDLEEVACDSGVLTSMVSNLANNAIKYIGDGELREVTIRARAKDAKDDDGGVVRIDVIDTGPGLPAGLEKLVFEPYVRGQGMGGVSSGIGLGLATVRRLAEAHGGRVGVVSRIGEGCSFWFELPSFPSPDSARGCSKPTEKRHAVAAHATN